MRGRRAFYKLKNSSDCLNRSLNVFDNAGRFARIKWMQFTRFCDQEQVFVCVGNQISTATGRSKTKADLKSQYCSICSRASY